MATSGENRVVRLAEPEDLLLLEELIDGSTEGAAPCDHRFPRARLIRLPFEQEGFLLFVADSGGVRAGYGLLRLDGDPSTPGSSGMIYDLFVAAPFRRRGIGTLLLEFLVAHCEASGYGVVRLLVNVDNPAIRLYRRLGFEERRLEMYRGSGRKD